MAYADQKKGLEAKVNPSANQFQYIDEKAESQNSLVETPGSGPLENKARLKLPAVLKNSKMFSFRHFLITFTVFVILTITYTSAAAIQSRNGHGTTVDEIRFQELLDTVSDASLHSVLEQYVSSKYQPGVYEKDRTAIQAVHQDDAAVATSLVELAKRQNNSSMTIDTDTVTAPTTPTVPPETSLSEPTTTSPDPTTNPETNTPSATPETSDSAVSNPLPTTTTPPVPTSDESSSILHSSAPTNTDNTSQTTATPGTTPSTSAPSATSVPDSSSHQSSSEAATTSKNIPNTSTARAATSHDAASTDGDKTPSSTTRKIVYTTLHADGSRSTVTSYTIVPASQDPTSAGSSPTETPGLQDAAVRCDGAGIAGYALIAIVGMVVAL